MKNKNLVPVSIRLKPVDKKKLEAICKKSDSNKSEFLRKKISTFLNSTFDIRKAWRKFD